MRRLRWLQVSLLATVLAVSAACGSSSSSGGGSGGSAGTEAGVAGSGGSSGSGGSAGMGGSGGTGATGGNGGSAGMGGSSGTGGTGGSCAFSSALADQAPFDALALIDQSGSMADALAGGTKWNAVGSGLTTFANSTQASGMGLGLQYFPVSTGVSCPSTCNTDPDCGACGPCIVSVPNFPGICAGASGNDSCTATDYATPDVSIAVLPGNAAAIGSSLAAHSPNGGSPLSAALQGGIEYASTWAGVHATHTVAVILATDGAPTECDTNSSDITAIAAAGLAGSPPVFTFVIGVGGSQTLLDSIANAGGTQQAQVTSSTQELVNAMDQIQLWASCRYLLPTPSGGTFDKTKLNLRYASGGTQIVPQVASESSCPASGAGWYYDDPTNPSVAVLCPDFCSTVASDSTATLTTEYGCPTVSQ